MSTAGHMIKKRFPVCCTWVGCCCRHCGEAEVLVACSVSQKVVAKVAGKGCCESIRHLREYRQRVLGLQHNLIYNTDKNNALSNQTSFMGGVLTINKASKEVQKKKHFHTTLIPVKIEHKTHWLFLRNKWLNNKRLHYISFYRRIRLVSLNFHLTGCLI